ncbi:MAG: ABC transporter ATP-binding protein/permease [Anaerolineae bacterium]|nr:ABC transporter ATP-binding protein/permease [Anaerolineae bacterium]
MSSEFIARIPYKTNHTSSFRFIISHIARHPVVGMIMVIGAFSNAALAAAVPYFIGLAFNAVIAGSTIEGIVGFVFAIIASQLLRGVLQLGRNFSSEIFAQRIERDVRDELYASLLGKSMTFHDMQPVGEIMARVTNDVREMNLMMNPGMNLIIGSGFFLLAPLVAAPAIYPSLILTPIIFLTLYFITQYRFITTLHPIAEKVRASFGHMNASLAETIDGLQVVKGAAKEEQEIAEFNHLADTVASYFIRQGRIEARYLPFLLLGLATVGGFIHSIILYQAGEIDAGKIIAFMGQLFMLQFPVYSSLRSLSQVALGFASAARILKIITIETDLDQNESGYKQPMRGAITFKNVTFGYTDGNPVIHDVSFTVQPGQTVAIVGQTGSGKTTLTKLVNRIYDVDSGEVLVDGINVKDWNLAALRSQISIIEQDIFLFSRSIADNIAFAKPDMSPAEIEAVANKAQAHDFISTFPEGYETVVGQRGVTLSGGQRQRLAIARAFLTDPPILVLDDSTSAIDSATEDRIQQAIWAASKGRTTILITHRLSQIRWADHIVVMRQGRVVAQGNHEDLLQTSDAYRRIFARYEMPEKSEHILES